MTRHAQLRKWFRYALAGFSAVALAAFAGARTAHAQALTLDYTINSDINSAVTAATVSAGATETVDVWATVTPGTTGDPNSNLGIIDFYWGGTPSVTGSFTNLGSGSTTGANTGVGVTAGTIASNSLAGFDNSGSDFGTSNAAIGDWGDWDLNGVSKEGNTKADTAVVSANSGLVLGNGSDGGEALTGTNAGWAWLVGTMTVTIPNGTGTLTLTPRQSSISGINAAWTTTGSSTGAVNNETSSADALQVGSAVTFTVGSVSTSTALTLAPSSLTFNVLKNGTAAGQDVSLTETSGSGTASYAGTVPANFTIGTGTASGSNTGNSSGNGAAGTVGANGVLTLPVGYTGSTATDGTATAAGTYTVTSTTGTVNGSTSGSTTFNVVVGNATDDTSGSGTFTGSVLQGVVANGGSYGGLASSSNGGTKAANSNTALPGIEGSTATILAGTNGQGSSMTVSMTWRSRDLNETPGNDSVNGTGWPNGSPTAPPLPNGSQHPLGLISDVVNLYGMSSASTGASPGTTVPALTDVFAFEMSFNPATLIAEGATGNAMASHGQLYVASLIPFASNLTTQTNGGTPYWVNTIVGNQPISGSTTSTYGMGPNNTPETINVGASAVAAMEAGNSEDTSSAPFARPLLESFNTWAEATFDITAGQVSALTSTQLAPYLGVWGVDTTGDEAWAVIDHNSEFSVVPEPSTIALAALGLIGVGISIAKRRKLAA